jgi:hypothetical protein
LGGVPGKPTIGGQCGHGPQVKVAARQNWVQLCYPACCVAVDADGKCKLFIAAAADECLDMSATAIGRPRIRPLLYGGQLAAGSSRSAMRTDCYSTCRDRGCNPISSVRERSKAMRNERHSSWPWNGLAMRRSVRVDSLMLWSQKIVSLPALRRIKLPSLSARNKSSDYPC